MAARRSTPMVVLLVFHLAAASARAQPPAAPTTRPVEERADRTFSDQMSRLDAEYRAKKTEILRRYVSQLVVAKNQAIKAGDRENAQRLVEKIASVNAEAAELAPPAPPAEKPAASFSLRLAEFNGAAGLTNAVDVTASDVSVTAEDDFGTPPKVVWEAKLSAEQQDRLTTFLRSFPLNRLRDSYVDPDIADGYQMSFTIRLGDAPARRITVANRRQRDLERLVDEVNGLLPREYQLHKMSP